MLSCEQLTMAVTSVSLVKNCDLIANGMLRLATPFRHPNGSTIDLFLGHSSDNSPHYYLTDLGETIATLLDLHLKPWTTKKRKQIVSDICTSLGVEHDGGEFKISSVVLDELSNAIVRLAQVCIRVSDLAFTQRHAIPAGFKDDVEEFISSLDFPYEADVELAGFHGNPVVVDFKVSGKTIPTLIQTISSASAASAHPVTNEVFRKWYDLLKHSQSHQRVSIYDSRNNVIRADDLARLSDVSAVLAFPEQQAEISEILAA